MRCMPERSSYDGEVVVLNAADVIVSRCCLLDDPDRDWWWHRAWFIETAKAGLAIDFSRRGAWAEAR